MDTEGAEMLHIGETLEFLTANPTRCSKALFPAMGITLVIHSAGDGQWDLITESDRRGVIDVTQISEEELLRRMAAAVSLDNFVSGMRARIHGPRLVSDVEAHLAREAG